MTGIVRHVHRLVPVSESGLLTEALAFFADDFEKGSSVVDMANQVWDGFTQSGFGMNPSFDYGIVKYGQRSLKINAVNTTTSAFYVKKNVPYMTDFHVRFYLYIGANNHTQTVIFSANVSDNTHGALWFNAARNPVVRDNAGVDIASATVITTGVWHSVEVRLINGLMYVYLDGTELLFGGTSPRLVCSNLPTINFSLGGDFFKVLPLATSYLYLDAVQVSDSYIGPAISLMPLIYASIVQQLSNLIAYSSSDSSSLGFMSRRSTAFSPWKV